jgi:AcrR family transcriptional regulator
MSPEPPRSRRDRPAKPALTRQAVIDAALVILRDEGLDKVTMRRVATALDTGHASLYVYVRDTEDLHAQLLDAQLAAIRAGVSGPWRDRLKTLLISYGEVLSAYPAIARMALSTQPSGPNYAALIEAVLGLLGEGGVSDQTAAWGVQLLLLFPTAIAVEHSSPHSKDFSGQSALLASVDAATYPNIARIGDDLLSGDGPARSDWALDVLIDGILAASAKGSS